MSEHKKCYFCGVSLWTDPHKFKNYLYYDHFLDTGKCQKCQSYDEFLGIAKPKKIGNYHKKKLNVSKIVSSIDLDKFDAKSEK